MMKLPSAVAAACTINALLVAAVAALHGPPPRPAPPATPPLWLAERIRDDGARGPAAPEPPRPEQPEPAPTAPPLPLLAPAPIDLPAVEMAFDVPIGAVHVPPPDVPVSPVLASRSLPVGRATAVAAAVIAADGDVDEPARWDAANREPTYPRGLQRRRVEGEVTVRLLIDAAGRVEQASLVLVRGGEPFGEAVLEVAPSWRFVPARDGGRAVPVYARKTIWFRLAER